MARQARGEVFDPLEVSTWHCINRCVRRCFLCGHDPVSGKNFDHRKQWLEARFRWLAANFGIDVLGFAILSNHFHLVMRNRPDVVATWSDEEVARRWLYLCPLRKTESGQPEEPTDAEMRSITGVASRLTEIRHRLSDISWFMRMVAEPVARQANAEEDIHGRFWQGRFRSVKLCDGQIVAGKRGAIPEALPPILTRLGIATPGWLELASNFGRLYHRVAGGCSAVQRERTRRTSRPFRCRHARLLGSG